VQELLQVVDIQVQELLQVEDIQVQEHLLVVATQEQELLLEVDIQVQELHQEVAIQEQGVQDIQEQLLPLIQQWPSGSRPWTRTTVVRLTPRSSARPSPTAT